MTKNFAARPTRLGWSGYDASEARSVHRESLWNPKRERAGLAISPRVSHRWPPPSQPVAAGPCNPRPRPRGRGEPHDALLTCHDAPMSGNVLARRASLNGGLRSARTTGPVSSKAPRRWPGQPGRTPMSVRHVLNPLVPGRSPERRRRRLSHGARARGALASLT